MYMVEHYAAFAAAYRTQGISPEVMHHAKRAVIDWFAALFPGAVMAPATLLEKGLADELGHGKARLALGGAAPARMAALINGSAAHTAEVDDIYRDGIYHPGAPTIAAALALAQAKGVDGNTLLRAVIVGYEISTRIGAAMGRNHYKYFHNTGTIGCFGAAAAAAEILGLDAARFAHALATVATFSAALQQAFRMDSMSKPLHAGHAAEAGVLAALAAAEGVTGSLDVLEGDAGYGNALSHGNQGPDWATTLATLGRDFHITKMTFKNHACCGHSFAAIDGALALKAEMGINARDVKRIRIGAYRATLEVAGYDNPQTPAEARFSVKYCVATALTHGNVRLAAFEPARILHPATHELVYKTELALDPEIDAAFPKQRAARVLIETYDGRSVERFQPTRKGDPDAPLTDGELEEKYLELAIPVVGAVRAKSLLAQLRALDEIKDLATLTPAAQWNEALARALFAPRTIALVGASGDASKNTARPQRFLAKHGFAGTIVPINPTRAELFGVKAYPTLAAAHAALGPIDHAYVMAPGEAVERAVEDCGACGIPVVAIFSDGFSEVGPEGAVRQARLVETARAAGVRLLGPNSMGVVDVRGHIAITVNAVLEGDAPPAGSTSVVSQSGTMLGTLISRGAARGLGFAKLVSVGNEADLGVAELVDLLVDDADTRVIALFLETVRDAPGLARAARRAHAAGKPVVAFKLGRSALGEAMARSHTGAMAGTDAAVDAFFRECGVVRVDMLETLIEIAPLLAGHRPVRLGRKPRVAVVTTTGGGAASVVDRLGTLGMDAMVPSDALKSTLEGHGVRVADSPIVDLTMAGTGKRYANVLASLFASPDCDAVLAVVGSSAQFHPEVAVDPILRSEPGDKPLAVFLTPQADRSLTLLAQAGIAAFRTPEACADALAAFFRWRAPRAAAGNATVPSVAPQFKAGMDEADALALFAALGVPVVHSATATAPDYAHDVPYPVAAKVRSRDIAHKTEAGGVLLGIADAADFAARVPAMLAAVKGRQPQAHIEGALVQHIEKGLLEVILGFRRDPMVGPVVMLGAGGVLAEVYKDYALRAAPVSEAEALEMIDEVKGLALIRGYRNLPRGDLAALARATAAFSRLALLPGEPVLEAEINPLIVKSAGVVAVDGLVVARSA